MKALPVMLALTVLYWSTYAISSGELTAQLKHIKLPAGFEIALYAEGVEGSRQLALGEKGTIFAGSIRAGKVHAIVDRDGDNKADHVYLIDEGLQLPSGLEFKSGALYVAALDKILRYDDIESLLENPPNPTMIANGFPDKSHHGWKYLRFGPDNQLYIPIGAPCNICDEPGFAQIRRLSADNSTESVFAEGLRNTVGIAFHPETGELWATDNGRDMMGDDIPADELNHAPRVGMHFGPAIM